MVEGCLVEAGAWEKAGAAVLAGGRAAAVLAGERVAAGGAAGVVAGAAV